jgi:hypothetical protein
LKARDMERDFQVGNSFGLPGKFEVMYLKNLQEVSPHFVFFFLLPTFAILRRKDFFFSGIEVRIRRLNSKRFERWPRRKKNCSVEKIEEGI